MQIDQDKIRRQNGSEEEGKGWNTEYRHCTQNRNLIVPETYPQTDQAKVVDVIN